MIVKAAVRYNEKIYTGMRHGVIFQDIRKIFPDFKTRNPYDQGFVDENGKYYNRVQAREHAVECGQLPNNFSKYKIQSEDLW